MKKENVNQMVVDSKEYEEFKKFKEQRAKENKRQAALEIYRQMVDDEIERSITCLLSLSKGIKETKEEVMNNFKSIIEMKSEQLNLVKDDQRSHTFTNTKGDKRIILGVYTIDGYLDTVEDGIAIVKEYLESLASDHKSKSLVAMILKLLSRDSKGSLKASRIVQLRKYADEIGNSRFKEGVQIIEDSYQPALSKQFIRAEIKNENGAWISVPLGMTEA